MPGDLDEFASRAPKLRAYSASRRGAKQERNRLVLEHGEWLAQFTVQSLSALPPEGAAGTDAISRLECAQEAAGLLLTLAAFPSPEPEKLCYNVALRCHALGRPAAVLELTGSIVQALRKPVRGAAGAKAGAEAGLAHGEPGEPRGGEGAPACELAVSARKLRMRPARKQRIAAADDLAFEADVSEGFATDIEEEPSGLARIASWGFFAT